jgi:DNA-binding MarR family transcriptional regulator
MDSLSPCAPTVPENLPDTPDLSRLYSRPGFLLRRAHQISAAVFEDECRAVALTPAQFGVLTVLRAGPGMDQSSLARALGFDKVTVLRVLRGLESRGLVQRSPAPTSRRNLAVALSPEGSALLDKAQKPAERAYRRLSGVAGRDAPARQRGVVRHARIHPARAFRRLLLFPERRLGLEVVHQEFAGLKALAPVGAGDGHQHDLVQRLQQPDAVDHAGAKDVKAARASSIMASMDFSVMPG